MLEETFLETFFFVIREESCGRLPSLPFWGEFDLKKIIESLKGWRV